MSVVVRSYNVWRDVMDNRSDPRTTNWFMMSSPLPTMAMCLTYIFLVKVVGPKWMANRKAYDAKGVQFIYNIIHLAINSYIFYQGSTLSYMIGFNFRCQSVDYSTDGIPLKIARICWLYYLSKFTDFFETFIYIALKQFELVNLYHIAHHSIMPFSVWWGVKFLAGGHSTFFGYLNSLVHVVIYSYFVLTTGIPETKKYFFWWRAFYPKLQIGQFAIIFLHAFQLLYKNDCNYPLAFVYFIGGHAVLFYILVKNKMRNDRKAKEKAASDCNSELTKSLSSLYEDHEEFTESFSTTRQRAFVGTT